MSVEPIDECLANVSPEQQAAPEVFPGQIKAAAPGAETCISFGQPAFRKGRVVSRFGATKKHCAFYVFNDTTLDAFVARLTGFDVSEGTVRFQPDRPLRVKKLVKVRLAGFAALDTAKQEKRR